MKHFAIAIDGPSGAGKTTTAKYLAEKLRIIYVDTGALYRAVALHVLRLGIDPADAPAVIKCLQGIEIELQPGRVILGGDDISAAIREHRVSRCASEVSSIPAVRQHLFDYQRSFAKNNSVVMEGRDIGTVVLPDADIKLYLTATSICRAHRRKLQLSESGENVPIEQVHRDLLQRDRQDSTRAVSPLRLAEGGLVLDSTHLSLQRALDEITGIVRRHLGV